MRWTLFAAGVLLFPTLFALGAWAGKKRGSPKIAGWETLAQSPLPAMTTMRFSLFVDHWVVVLETDEDDAWIADPIRGVVRMSKEGFLGRWRKVLVLLDDRPAAGKSP